ncbi:hypothetical protein DFH09DRAFT_1094674 [Mycena vulgaris]|nr:hypothetical protein DFH09DRAFT_1109793 [Mycena vulgaris]KAJ6527874.1 hypothetical protein DFH09DRAFT_1094674 [Mycena vulgaris]
MLHSTLTAYIFFFPVFNLGAACNGSFHFQDHESPALAALFDEALPRVVEILAKFNDSYPLIAYFNTHFEGKPSFEQSRGASEWIHTFGLFPTPELEAVLQPAAQCAGARWPHQTPRAGRSQHVLGVGLALLQSLAIQQQLREPVNLNGDFLGDLLDGRMVQCPADGNEGLVAMFSVIPLPNQVLKTHALAKRMRKFNNAHTIYGPDYRPPTFRRDEPSQTATTAIIPLGSKRRCGEEGGDEPPSKRAKEIPVLEELNGRAGAGGEHRRICQPVIIHSYVAAESTALVPEGLPLRAAMRAAVQA